jgi:hypothetical protein
MVLGVPVSHVYLFLPLQTGSWRVRQFDKVRFFIFVRHIRHRSMDCDECEAHMKDAILRSERVKKLLNKVKENDSATNLKMTVLDCSSNAFLQNCRAYTADPPLEIVLCANSLKDRDEVEVALLYLITILAFILHFLIMPTLSLSWSIVITG